MPELQNAMTIGALGVDDVSCAYFLTRGARTAVALPPSQSRTEYLGVWYNPFTDQNIFLPRTTIPESRILKLATPSPDPWIYSVLFLPTSTDADTTTPVVLQPPPENDETTSPDEKREEKRN
jgi:hypothetical protein